MNFYLGTHKPTWLKRTSVPLFLSAVQMRTYKRLPRALGPHAWDSGGFSELHRHGRWTIEPERFVDEVRAWSEQAGVPDFVAIQDWMCEPFMVARTGLSIQEHQCRTVLSLAALRKLAPEVAWMPVLQGWDARDYVAHFAMYKAAGFDLTAEQVVGVGSVCRRQSSRAGERVMREIAGLGVKIHALGIKVTGLARFGDLLQSSDSLAWSFQARKKKIRLDGCPHLCCANCQRWAEQWYRRVIETPRPSQLALPV